MVSVGEPYLNHFDKWEQEYRWGFCMGTLVSNRHILTSASCVNVKATGTKKEWEVGELKVWVGLGDVEHDLNIKQKEIIKIIYAYVQPNEKSDVAILVMEFPVEFGREIRPICLPDDDIKVKFV